MQSGANPEKTWGMGGPGQAEYRPLGSDRPQPGSVKVSGLHTLSTKCWSSNLMPSPWGSQRHRGLIRKSSDLSSWESGSLEQSFKGELLRLLTHPSHRAHQQVKSGGVRAGPGAWEFSHGRHPFCPPDPLYCL